MRCFALTLLCFALAACGGDEPPAGLSFADAPTATTTTVLSTDNVESSTSAPTAESSTENPTGDRRDPIVIDNDRMISFQAGWVCELQRRTFVDLSDMDAAFADALAEAELGQPAYNEFLKEMANSQAIRDEVLSVFGERCQA